MNSLVRWSYKRWLGYFFEWGREDYRCGPENLVPVKFRIFVVVPTVDFDSVPLLNVPLSGSYSGKCPTGIDFVHYLIRAVGLAVFKENVELVGL